MQVADTEDSDFFDTEDSDFLSSSVVAGHPFMTHH